MLVAVVGVCASGKTTLAVRLRELGVNAYHVAQEHSGVKKLWNKRRPDLLIMLDASLATIRARRRASWGEERLEAQRRRLGDARANADLYLPTDGLDQEQVTRTVFEFIRRKSGDGDSTE